MMSRNNNNIKNNNIELSFDNHFLPIEAIKAVH